MSDRHSNYRQLTAKRPGTCSSCNAPFPAGAVIGWNPRNKNTCCESCWRKWCAEVREERDLEAAFGSAHL